MVIGPNAIIYYGDSNGENCKIEDGVSIRESVKIGAGCRLESRQDRRYNYFGHGFCMSICVM